MGALEDMESRWLVALTTHEQACRDQGRQDADLLRVLDGRTTQFESEHQALSRRMHAIESESNQAQHGEIQALSRRFAGAEALAAQDKTLLVTVSVRLDTLEAAMRDIAADLLRLDGAEKRLAIVVGGMVPKEADLLAWMRGERAWYALPWWKRLWRELRGRRAESITNRIG